MGQRRSTLASAALALAAALGGGCYPSGGRGKEPPSNQLDFPVSVTLSPPVAPTTAGGPTVASRWLFVANSDFQLEYNSGTVQALELGDETTGIEAAVRACAAELASTDCGADPYTAGFDACQAQLTKLGCNGIDASQYIKASVRIGAFASDMKVVPLYDPSKSTDTPKADVSRILVPVRGDASLTYIDAIESNAGITLNCYASAGVNEQGHDCDANHRIGQVATADARQLTLEGEPFAIATPGFWSCTGLDATGKCPLEPARSNGIASVVHQVSGDVSVFRNVQLYGGTPVLSYGLGGLPASATAIAALDLSDGVSATSTPMVPFVPRFLVANRSQSSLMLVSYLGDDGNPDRSVLTASSLIPITTQSTGYDTRGVVVDPPGQGEGDRPTRVFLASRSPTSIVVGEIDKATGSLHFYDNVPLPIGPSRITRSSLVDAAGIAHTRIYVASYDSAYVVSYDPETRRLGSVIKSGRGPYSIAIDDLRKLAYVVNFIDGTVQVIDVSTTIPDPSDKTKTLPNPLFERVLFTVGIPQGPRS